MATYDPDASYDDVRAERAIRTIVSRCPELGAEAVRALQVVGIQRQMRLDRLIPRALEAPALTPRERALLAECAEVGRQPEPGQQRRTVPVQVKFTEDERDALGEAAAAEGLTLSDLIRRRTLG